MQFFVQLLTASILIPLVSSEGPSSYFLNDNFKPGKKEPVAATIKELAEDAKLAADRLQSKDNTIRKLSYHNFNLIWKAPRILLQQKDMNPTQTDGYNKVLSEDLPFPFFHT